MRVRTIAMLGAVLGSTAMLLSPDAAFAAKFANQFVEFELPPQWQCSLEGAEWVCQSTDDKKKRDAIIVLAAKLKGDQDSLDQYKTYLSAPKSYTDVQGRPVKSEFKYAEIKNINGDMWVDALHLESEIPGFYTRYLATVKQDIGVLVTYSIAKSKYQDYLGDFDTMVKTLRVFRKQGGINANPSGNLFNVASIPAGAVGNDAVFAPPTNAQGGSDQPNTARRKSGGSFGLIAVLAGVVGYFWWRRRQNIE